MSGPQTYLSIEDLVEGYSNLFDTVENFYEKLQVQHLFNILNKLRYNLVKKKATKNHGPKMTEEQRSHASLHYQLLGNTFNDYAEYCKDTNEQYNYDVVRVFSQINNDSEIVDSKLMKKHIKKVIELWEAQPDKNDLSKVYEYILEFYSPFKVQLYDGSFKSVTTVLQQKIRYNEFSINDFSNFMYSFCKFMTEDSVFNFLFEETGAIKKRTKRKAKGKTSKKEASKKGNRSKARGKTKAKGKANAKRYTGGYKTEEIAKMFNDLEIAHDSLTIDTLLLYDTINPEINEGSDTYIRRNKVIKKFMYEYNKKFSKFKIDGVCDEVMAKLNEFDLDSFISRDHTIFSNPSILIELFKKEMVFPIIDSVSKKENELIEEYKTLNGLNVETPDINMSRTFDSTKLYDLKLKDLRNELQLSNKILSYLRRNITGNYQMYYQNLLNVHQPSDVSVPLMESSSLNKFLRLSTDVFFEIQCILVNFMKLYISAIQTLHHIIVDKVEINDSNNMIFQDSLLKLLVVHRFLTLHRDGIYTENPIIFKALNLESPDSINATLSNLELSQNDDFRMLLMNIYRLMERVKGSIRDRKRHISRSMVGRRTIGESRPNIQDRYDEDGRVVRDLVPKDSFYNVLLPDTIVREIDPDSRHICLKKSTEWTKEKPKYLMMNLKTKKRSEIEFDNLCACFFV